MYDFTRCKLCGCDAARPTYRLREGTIYTCASCDFHFIDHLDVMPDEDENRDLLDRKSWSFIEQRLPANGKQHVNNLRLIKKHCPVSEARCLDIGAGAGLFLKYLSDEGACVHGIEPQKVFREFARKKFGISLHRELVDDPLWQVGFSRHFDIVTMWDVLEHVNFPAETLAAASRLIRQGGWLFLDTPRRDSLFHKISEWAYRLSGGSNALLLGTLYSPKPFRHKQLFTLQQLLQLVQASGFVAAHISSSPVGRHNRMVLACRKP